MAIAHNGKLTNSKELRSEYGIKRRYFTQRMNEVISYAVPNKDSD